MNFAVWVGVRTILISNAVKLLLDRSLSLPDIHTHLVNNQLSVVAHAAPCHRVGTGTAHHFFGYYNKSNWDGHDRLLLAQQVPGMDADLTEASEAEVGFFDPSANNLFTVVGKTTAWNWQMGSQLQWLGGLAGRQCLYNVRTSSSQGFYPGFGSCVHDVESGTNRMLPMPVYVAAPNSQWALCVDYERLWITHETIGYVPRGEAPRLHEMPVAPAQDGIHRMELASGKTRLLVSYAQLRNFHPRPSMERAIHWVSHIEINPSSTRVLFLHRWTERVKDETCFLHRLITMAPDGSDMRLLECSDHPLPQLADDFDPTAVGTFDYEKSEYQISHPLWKNDRQIVVWSPHDDEIHYHLYTDADGGAVEVLGPDVLTENGHMTFSPVNERWLLSDTYPDATTNQRALFLFDMQTGIRHDLGQFYTDPALRKENRCDLHPRWSHDGLRVCIDSVHESVRQMYVVDVAEVVTAAG